MQAREFVNGELDLALETSTRKASLALQSGGHVYPAELHPDAAHASDLLGHIERLLEQNGLNKQQLKRVHVGIGPGSFTGLRVGAAVALGLQRALGIDLVALPSVQATAWAGLKSGETGSVVLDARGGAAYVASYQRSESNLQTLLAPTRVRLTDAPKFKLPEGVLLGDERAVGWFDKLGQSTFPARSAVAPSASDLMRLGRAQWLLQGASDPESVRPLYLAAFGD